MRVLIIVVLLISLLGCGQAVEVSTTDKGLEDTKIDLVKKEVTIKKGDIYDFPYKNYQLSNNLIVIKDKVLVANEIGETILKIDNYEITINIVSNDLEDFYLFVNDSKLSGDYNFKVYSGSNYYTYKEEKGAFLFSLSEFSITTSHIKPNTKARPQISREVKWIVIHDTGNITSGANAVNHGNYLSNLAVVNQQSVSWHYSIDEANIINHIPNSEVAWHAGDGLREVGEGNYLGGGNLNGIGIEMCINQGNDIVQTMKNTAKLTAKLIVEHGLNLQSVKQHSDFAGKMCPYTIIINDLWNDFMKMVETEYLLITKYKDYQIIQTSSGYLLVNKKSGNEIEMDF